MNTEPSVITCASCGTVIGPTDQRRCASCAVHGCTNCLPVLRLFVIEANVEHVCGPLCGSQYLRELATYEQGSHEIYQRWVRDMLLRLDRGEGLAFAEAPAAESPVPGLGPL